MKYGLFTDLVLTRDLPEHDLHRGDVVRLLGHHLGPNGGELYSIETLDASGKTLATAIVDETALRYIEKSGYTVARMPFAIVLAPQAVEDLRQLKATVRAAVKEAIGVHLRHEPDKVSRSRIKRLRGISRPQYRLRVDDVRVFYDITGNTVEVLSIVPKSEATSWLAQFGKAE